MTRFRTLRVGDYVAARLASHELWILARVVREWKALDISNGEFMGMTEVSKSLALKKIIATLGFVHGVNLYLLFLVHELSFKFIRSPS